MATRRDEKGQINIGGNVEGSAILSGNSNSQTVTYSKTLSPDHYIAIDALAEIAKAIASFSGPFAANAALNAEVALKEARNQKTDKAKIGSALCSALETAKKSADFVGSMAKIGPLVRQVATWLGEDWGEHLKDFLG
jgi:hypothetical protein